MTEHLTTGWEPDVAAGDTLLRASVLTMADRARHQTRSLGGRVEEGDGFVLTGAGGPSFFLNGAVLLAPDAAEAAVARALDFYDGPFAVFCPWPTGDLTGSGLQLAGHPPLMLRPAGGSAPAPPPGLRIAEVTDAAGIETYRRVLVEGFPMPGLDRFLGEEGLGDEARLWIGWGGDRAVSVAAAHVGEAVVNVEWVATLPDARGKGYGAAVTWAATLARPSLPAVLISSDDGRTVYERMGYLPIVRFTLWFRQ